MINSDYFILVFLGTIFLASLSESRINIPYTMILVALGIIISLLGLIIPDIKQFNFDSRLIIDFVIPPLIFEAMMRIDYKDFKAVKISVLALATFGVVITTVVVGLFLMHIVHLPFQLAFVFAALLSSTDAAIVIKSFKILKVPRLLSTILEVESSFNDATGIIVFSSVVGIVFGTTSAITGSYTETPTNLTAASSSINFNLLHEIGQFLFVSLGGISIGLIIAAITNRLHTLMNNSFSEISLTIATLFGSAMVANSMGFSGLIAVAAAGIYLEMLL